MAKVPVSLLTQTKKIRDAAWTGFYAGYAAGTDEADLAESFVASLHYGYDLRRAMTDLEIALAPLGSPVLEAFHPTLLVFAQLCQPFFDTHGFLPYVGDGDPFNYLLTQRIWKFGQSSTDGCDALDSVYNIMMDSMVWDDDLTDAAERLDAYPFVEIATLTGVFMRQHVMNVQVSA